MLLYTSQIKMHFKDIGVPADVKYIDPTYMVRACRANASDAILCTVLGQNAVSLFSLYAFVIYLSLFPK
jgi:6-phosphofructokinase